MAGMHITRELLEAIAHAQEGERRGRKPGTSVEVLSTVLDRHLKDFQQGLDRARRDVAQLLTLPRDERIARIKRSRTRYQGPQAAWILLEESRKAVTTSPEEAEHLAEIARLVVQCSPGWVGCMGLLALSAAVLANACRAAGKLAEAESHFKYARSVITHEGVTDTEILGRIDHLEGLLRMEQHDFKVAEKLLSRAVLLFSVVGEIVERSRSLITLGGMYFLQGELNQAIETTRAGLRDLPSGEEFLYLCGRYNLARFLTESGRYQEAEEILQEDEELQRKLPEPWTLPLPRFAQSTS